MILHKNAKPAFFILLFFFSKSIFKRSGPLKIKVGPSISKLRSPLGPQDFQQSFTPAFREVIVWYIFKCRS